MSEEFTPEALKAIDQIQKLLNLAAKNTNEHEASAAAAKANELLIRYNLTSATVANAKPSEGKREEAKVEGGHYQFSRDLWRAVAELNFCVYWRQRYWVGYAYRNRHCLVGKTVNTRMTIAMAQYLEQAVERLVDEKLHGERRISNWSMSFRKGCFARIVERLEDRKRQFKSEELERQRKAEMNAMPEGSTSTALTVGSLMKTEEEANMDFIHGEGWSAKQAAKRAESAKLRAEAEADYTRWAAANPKAAASNWKFTDSSGREWHQGRKRSFRYSKGRDDKTDYGAYRAGYDEGERVSLDQQMDNRTSDKKLSYG